MFIRENLKLPLADCHHGSLCRVRQPCNQGDAIVRHIINGDTVLTYTGPQIGGGTVSGHDPAMKQDGKRLTEGYLALQSEGQPINSAMCDC